MHACRLRAESHGISDSILPVRLPPDMIERALAFIDGFCSEPDNYLAPTKLY